MSDQRARDLVLGLLDGALVNCPELHARFRTSGEVHAAVLSNVPALVAVAEMMQRSNGYSVIDYAGLIGDAWGRLLDRIQDADRGREQEQAQHLRAVEMAPLRPVRVDDLPEALCSIVGRTFPTMGFAVDGPG
jgi:hypothetical protein